ncbi:hypothetical protein BJX62DRAFT_28334 [Aspergillus germanicus]
MIMLSIALAIEGTATSLGQVPTQPNRHCLFRPNFAPCTAVQLSQLMQSHSKTPKFHNSRYSFTPCLTPGTCRDKTLETLICIAPPPVVTSPKLNNPSTSARSAVDLFSLVPLLQITAAKPCNEHDVTSAGPLAPNQRCCSNFVPRDRRCTVIYPCPWRDVIGCAHCT